MNAPHKVYPVQKNGHRYYLIKYKDEITKKWLSKYAPVDRDTPQKVEQWFALEFNPANNNTPPPKKSITNLYPLWEKHRRSMIDTALLDPLKRDKAKAKLDNLPNIIGHFKHHILNHTISSLDLETELSPNDAKEFIRSIKLAPNSVRNIIQSLRTFIDVCRMEQYIDFRTVNPFSEAIIIANINDGDGISSLAGKQNRIALTPDQANLLLSNERLLWRRRVRYWVAFATGLRDGELSALQWRDIDLVAPIPMITVDRQIRRYIKAPNDQFKPPKKQSFRSIPLHSKVVSALQSWYDKGWQELTGKSPQPNDPVFPSQSGLFFLPNSAAEFKDDLTRANLPIAFQGVGGKSYPFDFHSTRRTFASMLKSLHTYPEDIGALMGHAGKDTTARHYILNDLKHMHETIEKLPLTAEVISVTYTPACDGCGKVKPGRNQTLCQRCRPKKEEELAGQATLSDPTSALP